MKFRKKPVVIEAWEWDQTPEKLGELMMIRGFSNAWLGHNTSASKKVITNLRIKTLEGHHNVSDGDWIIKGVKGEFYPCKPDIFAMTYELAEQPTPEGSGREGV